MPEGDSVLHAARQIDEALAGRVLDRGELRVPRFAALDLTGRTVLGARARGKHFFVELSAPPGEGAVDGPVTLHGHLKMEGRIHVLRGGARWRFPAHTARLVLRSGDVEVVGTELGLLRALTPAEADAAVEHLGPDLLDPDFDPIEAERRIRSDPDRSIGEALLDQRVMAGIGTVYRAEICFLRGVDPRRPVAEVDGIASLVNLSRRLLLANVGRNRVTTGDTRPGHRLWVYGRRGPCLRCGTGVEHFTLGSAGPGTDDRTCYACPTCQPPSSSIPVADSLA